MAASQSLKAAANDDQPIARAALANSRRFAHNPRRRRRAASSNIFPPRASPREKARRVFAATPVALAAFCIADDFGLIRASNRAAAGPGRGVFYPRPGQELGREI
jgi:hypothetical protein